jgi:hypothetical protein
VLWAGRPKLRIYGQDRRAAQDGDQQGEDDERVWPAKGESNDPHAGRSPCGRLPVGAERSFQQEYAQGRRDPLAYHSTPVPVAFFFLRKAAAPVAHAVGVHVLGMAQVCIDPFGRQGGVFRTSISRIRDLGAGALRWTGDFVTTVKPTPEARRIDRCLDGWLGPTVMSFPLC